MDKLNSKIAQSIREHRKSKEYSQEYMALKLNISQQAYQKIESGKTKIDIERADKIAKCLQIDLKDLLNFPSADHLNDSKQPEISNINYSMPNMVQHLVNHIENLQIQLIHLREQNKKLLGIISNEKDR